MNFWFISAGILFRVLIGLAIILFYFYRQKFGRRYKRILSITLPMNSRRPLAVMKISPEVLLQEKDRAAARQAL